MTILLHIDKEIVVKKNKFVLIIVLVFYALNLTSCASQPSTANLPIIKLGEAVPTKSEYILYLPAGEVISTRASIIGNIFNQEASKDLNVTLKRGIYSYKKWLSYDKKIWLDANDVLSVTVDLKLPSYEHPKSGVLTLKLSEKEL